MKNLRLYFQPHLTTKERQLCKRFWLDSELDNYLDVINQVLLLQRAFKLEHSQNVFIILNKCQVFDSRQRCEICQILRRIHYPFELNYKQAQAINKQMIKWRCDECLNYSYY
ncbi:hypothetical protein [Psychrobacter sp. I-STPA10]|uniref:hypothetical protein n=1 Tax=Psychrobacter sp. I-STPA10 TaxID=2585769 RepID=UPI001E3D92F5|nr:hypothetical protein [Psychrobacter sp. I-STPA10]